MLMHDTIEYQIGDDWTIAASCQNADGTPLDLVGATSIVWDLLTLDGGTPVRTLNYTPSPDSGIVLTENPGEILINLSHDLTDDLDPTYYLDMLTVTTAADLVTTQFYGHIRARNVRAMANPQLSQFRFRFPEFEDDDDIVSLCLDDATAFVDEDGTFVDTDKRARAITFLGAHYLKLRKDAADLYASGLAGGATIQSLRVEDRLMTFAPQTQATATKQGLAETTYGKLYLQLLRTNRRTVLRC